jgi:hypothetical protein
MDRYLSVRHEIGTLRCGRLLQKLEDDRAPYRVRRIKSSFKQLKQFSGKMMAFILKLAK